MKFVKGQIPIPLILSIASFVAAPIIGYYTAQAAIDDKIDNVKQDVIILQTQLPYIVDQVEEANEGVKDIKRALNIY